MRSRTSFIAFIAISFAVHISQTTYSQDASDAPSRRGFSRTQRSGDSGDLNRTPTAGQRDAIRRLRERTEIQPPRVERPRAAEALKQLVALMTTRYSPKILLFQFRH
ncbi:MAG: hypothetical protein ACK5YR_01205 [Pirellula sp.]